MVVNLCVTAMKEHSVNTNLKNARQAQGLSMAAAAREVGVSRTAWLYWERGAPPRLENAKKVADLLGVQVERLF